MGRRLLPAEQNWTWAGAVMQIAEGKALEPGGSRKPQDRNREVERGVGAGEGRELRTPMPGPMERQHGMSVTWCWEVEGAGMPCGDVGLPAFPECHDLETD